MKRFKSILVCVNPEAQEHPALARAVKLAQGNDAAIKVVAVREELPQWARVLLPSKVQDWETSVVEVAKVHLESLVVPIRDSGLLVNTAVMVGQPFLELIRKVQDDAHDLLMKDLELDCTVENPVIGSTDMHLLRKCPCPVWLIKPSAGTGFKRILAAVDPIPGEDAVTDSVNTKIMELATSLAVQEKCKLFVVRAYESLGEEFRATELESREYSDYMERIQMVRLKADGTFIGKFANLVGEFDARYVFGTPGVIIPQIARDEKVDLVIMGTVARTGVRGLLMGRTAETVLRRVDCSVLGVKPTGFVSPI